MRGQCKPIHPSRTDFGAVLGRCLLEMEFSRDNFSNAIRVQKTQISALINNNPNYSTTKTWIIDKDILKTLEAYNPVIFAKYEQSFDDALKNLETKKPKPYKRKQTTPKKKSIEEKPSLSPEWRQATTQYVKRLIKFYGDDPEDIIHAIKKDVTKDMPPSITRKFLESATLWNQLLGHQDIETPVVYVQAAFNALNQIYYVDEQHPLHSKRQKTEIALGLK